VAGTHSCCSVEMQSRSAMYGAYTCGGVGVKHGVPRLAPPLSLGGEREGEA
jgi:hypothetical protein